MCVRFAVSGVLCPPCGGVGVGSQSPCVIGPEGVIDELFIDEQGTYRTSVNNNPLFPPISKKRKRATAQPLHFNCTPLVDVQARADTCGTVNQAFRHEATHGAELRRSRGEALHTRSSLELCNMCLLTLKGFQPICCYCTDPRWLWHVLY